MAKPEPAAAHSGQQGAEAREQLADQQILDPDFQAALEAALALDPLEQLNRLQQLTDQLKKDLS